MCGNTLLHMVNPLQYWPFSKMSALPLLKLTTATWSTPNEGLFDYHSHNISLQSFPLSGALQLLRKDDRCLLAPLIAQPAKGLEPLLAVVVLQGED